MAITITRLKLTYLISLGLGKANSASLKLDEIPLGMDQFIPNWILFDILTNSNHLELEYLVPCKPSYWLAPHATLTEHKAA